MAPPDISRLVVDSATYQRSLRAFKRFDRNDDGVIDRQELSKVFMELDPDRWDEKRVDRLMDLVDTNCDGKIQYAEFVAWLLGNTDSTWEADRGAAGLCGYLDFSKESLVTDRRETRGESTVCVVQVDQSRGAAKVGVQVDASDGRTLLIKTIKPKGAFAAFNAESAVRQIKAGDRIVDINGINENTKLMMKELTKRVLLDISIRPRENATCFVHRIASFYDVHPSELSIGEYSCVRKAIRKGSMGGTKDSYAIKSLHKKATSKRDTESMLAMMKGFDHPNIARLLDIFEDQLDCHLVLELCEGRDLMSRIIEDRRLSELQAVRVIRQILAAVGYLHSRSICHRDLRPEHLLLRSQRPLQNATIKLVDFRVAREFNDQTQFYTRVCPAMYASPEIAKSSGYNQSCDMWACGIIAYLCMSGYVPYVGETDSETYILVERGAMSFPDDWSQVSSDAKDLILGLLEHTAEKRLTASQAIRHNWIERSDHNGIDFPLHKGQRAMKGFIGLNKLKKASLHAIAQRLRSDDIRELEDMFALLDKNGDKMVSFYELKAGLDRLGQEETLKDMQLLFEEVDVDGSMRLDYTEFLAAALSNRRHQEDALCWSAFQTFDLDGSGSICKRELAAMLGTGEVQRNMGVDDANMAKVIEECDGDGDGSIDFHEFMAMMRAGAHDAAELEGDF